MVVLMLLYSCWGHTTDCSNYNLQYFLRTDAKCFASVSVHVWREDEHVVYLRAATGLCDLQDPEQVPSECWEGDGSGTKLLRIFPTGASLFDPCSSEPLLVGQDYLLALRVRGFSCPELTRNEGYSAAFKLSKPPLGGYRVDEQEVELDPKLRDARQNVNRLNRE